MTDQGKAGGMKEPGGARGLTLYGGAEGAWSQGEADGLTGQGGIWRLAVEVGSRNTRSCWVKPAKEEIHGRHRLSISVCSGLWFCGGYWLWVEDRQHEGESVAEWQCHPPLYRW